MYDLIVIGGGPAGHRGAERAAKNGLKVALIEKRSLGGTCLNEGCIPSKAFLHTAKNIESIKASSKEGTIKIEGDLKTSQEAVVLSKDKIIKRLGVGIRSALKAAGVEVLYGEAYVLGKEKESFLVKVNDETYRCLNILIATGSKPIIPPIEGLSDAINTGVAITNEQALDLKEIPEKLVVIGGGVIGLEMGQYYSTMGSKVTVIEMLEQIGGSIDSEVASTLKRSLEKKGMTFETNSKVIKIEGKTVFFEKEGEVNKIEANKVLVSVGRRPDSQNKGFENIGLDTSRGIKTTLEMKTSVPNVYAAGDVNGVSLLAHTAYREADVAINNMLKIKDNMDYSSIPYVIYTSPEVAGAGETESSALEKGGDIKVVKLPLTYSGRYVVESEDRTGFIKLIYNCQNDTLIGASVIGTYSSEYISMISSFIGLKTPVEKIKKLVFPHPTVSEVFRDAIFEI